MARIVVVGSVNVDLIAQVERHPVPGETLAGTDLVMLPGGKGANQAVAAASLSEKPGTVALVGAVGTDGFAEVALSGLSGADVDQRFLRRVPGATGVALITVDAAGENSIVVVPGANAQVTPEWIREATTMIADAEVLVLQCEIPPATVATAARHSKGRVVLNFAPVVDLDPDALFRADPLVVNQHEAVGALEQLRAEVPDSGDDTALSVALLRAGVPSVVMTRGAIGALVVERDEETGEPVVTSVPTPRVKAIDTTGAGDAFVGALAHCLALGDGLVQAAAYAARVGAFSVLRRGAQPSYPSFDDHLPEVR